MSVSARLQAPLGRGRSLVPPLFRRRSSAFLTIPACFVSSAGLSLAVVWPYLGRPEAHRVALSALSLVLLAATTEASRPLQPLRVAALLLAVAVPALTLAGAVSQYTVDGRPVLMGGELHQALSLHDEAQAALLELESQRYLLALPRSQARGIPQEYRDAAERSRDISERWNPAARDNQNLPGQGFGPVLEALNVAADNQSDALTLYLQNAEAPQPEIEAASLSLTAVSGAILSEQLPILLEEAREGSLALLSGGS